MKDFFTNSVFFGVSICLISYYIGLYIRKKTGYAIFNPLLISIILVIGIVLSIDLNYTDFYSGSKYLSYLLTPATVCLAVPLYEKLNILKSNYKAILIGILSGVITNALTVLILAILLKLEHREYVTLLPKSITTAIGIGIADELGGLSTITATVIIITGVFGNVISDLIFSIFKIKEPIAKGIGLGTAAHAIGTAKAMEMGEIEGAMSSLSIAVTGLITVLLAPIFANII